VLLPARRDDEAIRLWRRAVELEPERREFRAGLVTAYAEAGQREQAEAALPAAGFRGRLPLEMLRGVMDTGQRDQGRAALRAWRASVPDRGSTYALLAWLYAGLREPDSALAMMRRGAATREPLIVVLLDDRLFDFLRSDPRWAALVKDLRGH
jgi:tetratricopeptide (TPR) repeat protein